MKNKLFMGVHVGILALVMSVPAVAVDTLPAKGQIQISDPSTGEQWNWELSASDISVGGMSRASNQYSSERNAEVNVDISEYLLKTMSQPVDVETVRKDDVTITVGLRYSADAKSNTVAIYRAYGSAPNNGLYYATNKKFYYTNPSVFSPIVKTPTTVSWSYETNSQAGSYMSELPPYALLDCRIMVGGMPHSYRDVSVIFELSSP